MLVAGNSCWNMWKAYRSRTGSGNVMGVLWKRSTVPKADSTPHIPVVNIQEMTPPADLLMIQAPRNAGGPLLDKGFPLLPIPPIIPTQNDDDDDDINMGAIVQMNNDQGSSHNSCEEDDELGQIIIN